MTWGLSSATAAPPSAGRSRTSPTIAPYDDFHPPKVKVAMKIGGYYKLASIGTRAWRRFAVDAGLQPDLVIDRARSLTERAPAAFSAAAQALNDPSDAMSTRLVDRVTSRAAECRTQLGSRDETPGLGRRPARPVA